MSLTDQLSNTNNQIIEDVVSVAKKLYPELDIQKLRDIIWMHWFYGTLDVVYKKNKLVSCVRWNISPSGLMCDVLDWWVDSNENGFRLMKHLIARNWHRFPSLKYLRFKRDFKYPGQDYKIISFNKLFHIKEK